MMDITVVAGDGEKFPIQINPCFSAWDLKDMVWAMSTINPKRASIWVGGQRIEREDEPAEYMISDGDVVYIVLDRPHFGNDVLDASRDGLFETVKRLVEADCDPYFSNPVSTAEIGRTPDIVEALVGVGVRGNVRYVEASIEIYEELLAGGGFLCPRQYHDLDKTLVLLESGLDVMSSRDQIWHVMFSVFDYDTFIHACANEEDFMQRVVAYINRCNPLHRSRYRRMIPDISEAAQVDHPASDRD